MDSKDDQKQDDIQIENKKKRTEKRKKDLPADGEKERTKRLANESGEETDTNTDKEEVLDNDSQDDIDTTVVEKEVEEEEDEACWNKSLGEAIDGNNITEIKLLLKQVMSDYRKWT